jgi:hypothetical protein
LFNQLDAAHVSWKGYAQDLNAAQGDHSAGVKYCGAPFATPAATASTTQPSPGSATATDQYVPKHFPFPWFDSILQSGDCNAAHIADVFDGSNGLYHNLQSESTTPAFSWITPNNCSDAHDAVCKGNNLSGGFSDPNTANAPKNHTGGLYAADLFLAHVIPEIEASPAFKDGGLTDITFDEAFPPFTFTGNSFSNSTTVPATAATSIAYDRPVRRSTATPCMRSRPARTRRSRATRTAASCTPVRATTRSSTGPTTASTRRHPRCPHAPA